MVKHFVCWKFRPELTAEKRAEIAREFNDGLQTVKKVTEGAVEIRVVYPLLDTSTMEIALDTTFETQEAFAAFQIRPDHLAVGAAWVKPYLTDRVCCDYEF